MDKDEASHAFRTGELYGERIGFIIRSGRHRQADDNPGSLVEFARRQHNQGVYVPHFPTRLRVAVNPDQVSPVGAPWLPCDHYGTSLPTDRVAMISPP